MYQIVGYDSDGNPDVIESGIISKGVAEAKLKNNYSSYIEDYSKVELDNESTPLGKM